MSTHPVSIQERPPGFVEAPAGRHALERWAVRALTPTRGRLLLWAFWATALAVELLLVVVLRDGHIYGWEQGVTRAFQSVKGRDPVFHVTSTLTNTISWPFMGAFVVFVGFLLLRGYRHEAAILILSFPLHVLAQFPKALVDRPRPSAAFDGIHGIGGLQSFPSGHAEYVITFYGFLCYLVVSNVRSRALRVAAVSAWLGLVLLTGFGRIALGRHWPLDVLASYLFGAALLSFMIWLYRLTRDARTS